jgi:hypothetical protein
LARKNDNFREQIDKILNTVHFWGLSTAHTPDSHGLLGEFAQDFQATADTPFKTNQVGQPISGLGRLTSGV